MRLNGEGQLELQDPSEVAYALQATLNYMRMFDVAQDLAIVRDLFSLREELEDRRIAPENHSQLLTLPKKESLLLVGLVSNDAREEPDGPAAVFLEGIQASIDEYLHTPA